MSIIKKYVSRFFGPRVKQFEWSIWTSWFIELPVEQALKKICEVGFKYIELSAEHMNEILARNREIYLDSNSRDRALSIDEPCPLNKLSSLLESLSLKAIHVHGPFDLVDFTSKSIYERIKEAEKWIEYAHKLGLPTIVCHPFTLRELSPSKCKEMNLKFYGEVVKFCREYGVKIALENIDSKCKYGAKISDLIEIIEALSDEYLGICLDTSHANLSAYPNKVEEAVLEAGQYVIATHLSDNLGEKDDHLMLGRGKIDWSKVLEAFREIGYSKPLNLEIPGEIQNLSTEEKFSKLKNILIELNKLNAISE